MLHIFGQEKSATGLDRNGYDQSIPDLHCMVRSKIHGGQERGVCRSVYFIGIRPAENRLSRLRRTNALFPGQNAKKLAQRLRRQHDSVSRQGSEQRMTRGESSRISNTFRISQNIGIQGDSHA